ncbi:hypothetical protein BKA80DRAFT_34505 [Phyllosticta citrichinensis]
MLQRPDTVSQRRRNQQVEECFGFRMALFLLVFDAQKSARYKAAQTQSVVSETCSTISPPDDDARKLSSSKERATSATEMWSRLQLHQNRIPRTTTAQRLQPQDLMMAEEGHGSVDVRRGTYSRVVLGL